MAFLSKLFGSTVKGPNLLNPENLELWNRVEVALNRVRPMLQADGGDIELVDVNGSTVTLKLVGACSHCSSSPMTMSEGVERALRDEIPELTEILLQ